MTDELRLRWPAWVSLGTLLAGVATGGALFQRVATIEGILIESRAERHDMLAELTAARIDLAADKALTEQLLHSCSGR